MKQAKLDVRKIRKMKKPQTLLVLMPEIVWGGAERQFRYLINNIKVDKIAVVCPHSYAKQTNSYATNEINNKNAEIVESRHPVHSKINVIIYYLCEIRKLLKEYNISTAIVYEAYGCYLIPYLMQKGVKVIYSERNSGEGIVQSKMLKLFVGKSDVITTNSLAARELLRKYYKQKIFLVKNGIETESIKLKPDIENANTILVPARISKVKNQMIMLRFLKKDTDFKGTVIFAGKTEDADYMDELCKYVEQERMHDRVDFIGFTSEMELLYQKADLVVLPSFVEGMSNIILECFARKIPILVSNIEMNTFTDNLKKWSFDPQVPDELVELFSKWVNLDLKEKKCILEENRNYVLNEHSLKKMTETYADIIEEIG